MGLQGYNLFAYCGSNPVNRIDVSGTDSREIDADEEDLDEEVPRGGLVSGGGGGYASSSNTSLTNTTNTNTTNTNTTNTNTTTANTNGSNVSSTVTLYRAVSEAEASSFKETGQLSCAPGQMEGKFFATSEAHALEWGQQLNADEIINIKVPARALSHGSVTRFRSLDSIGPAIYFSDISYLNSIIIH